jgi:hypothetical protein
MSNGTFLLGIFGLFGSVCFITWTVARTVLRMRQLQAQPPRPDLEARLERIEAAVEAIAIEVERNGELQRFNARQAMDALSSGAPAGPRPA